MKSKTILILVCLATLLFIGADYLIFNKYFGNDSTDIPQNVDNSQQTAVGGTPEGASSNSKGLDRVKLEDESELTPVITRAEQTEEGDVVIKAYIPTFKEGNCLLEMRSNDNLITSEVDVVTQPSYLLCEGFSVSRDNLTSGTWSIVVSYIIDEQTYESEGVELDVRL